jgi:hypothetical protein
VFVSDGKKPAEADRNIEGRHMKKTILITVVICIASSISTAQIPNIIRNGGFEKDADGDGMADLWQFAADKAVVATWKRDSGYKSRFSQKLICTAFERHSSASHAMLCQVDTIRMDQGRWYKISFVAKQQGITGGAIKVAVSNTKSWSNCGLQESFRPSSKWRKFEFVFRATQTIRDHVRLQFWYTSTGSFWLDDVKLELSGPVIKKFMEEVRPVGSVNLLPNSSFECGMSGWGSIADIPGWGGNLNLPVGTVDSTTGKFHLSSFKIALTPETIPVYYFDYFPLYRVPVLAPLLANRGWIPVGRGAAYTLSAYMKADSEDLAGILSIRQAFGRTLRRKIRLKTNWQRYDFTFEPRAEQVFVALGADLEDSKPDTGTVWIDAVQLEKGSKSTEYRSRSAIEVGLETNRVGNIFTHGQEPNVAAAIFNSGQVPRNIVLEVQTTDFDDKVVHKSTIAVKIPADKQVILHINPGVQRKGFYRFQLRCEEAAVAMTRPMRFAIIEPYTRADSLFGMNHAYPWAHLLELCRQMGICWFRDWSLKWHDVEPEKGRFDFAECDHQINRVLKHGLNVLGLLPFPSTNWSSSAGSQVQLTRAYPENRQRVAYMPNDFNDLSAYIRRTVGHYQDRLNVWEILNEPIYTNYALPRAHGYQVKDYVRFLKVAYQSVKATDADAFVIGGIAGSPTTYTREFIEAGGLRWVDALNLHSYPGLTSPEAYEQPLRRLREKMRFLVEDKPIWFTEGAYYADDDKPYEPYDSTWLKPVDSEAEAAEWQIKFNTILLAYGAEKIIYHSGTPGSLNNESLSGIFFEWAGAPRKMLVTQVAMANLLALPIRSFGLIESPGDIKSYRFVTHGRTVIVAWLKEGLKPRRISLTSKQWRAVDLLGNKIKAETVDLTERPVYFIAQGTTDREPPW